MRIIIVLNVRVRQKSEMELCGCEPGFRFTSHVGVGGEKVAPRLGSVDPRGCQGTLTQYAPRGALPWLYSSLLYPSRRVHWLAV